MKREALLRQIGNAARDAGLPWELLRQGSDHEIWSLAGVRVVIPRHREVRELIADRIRKHLEERLGDRWWRA